MNTPWILDEVESDVVARILVAALRAYHERSEAENVKIVEALLAQYCGPRKLSIDYKEWKFVRFI